jgi:hypothetical protein
MDDIQDTGVAQVEERRAGRSNQKIGARRLSVQTRPPDSNYLAH